MTRTWRDLKADIEAETKRIWLEEPEELQKIHKGTMENRAGSYGQYFTTIDHANGMVRDFSNSMYQYLRSFMHPSFTLENCKVLVSRVHPGYIDYLRYSNFLTWSKFDQEFQSMLDTFETKEDFIELYKSYLKYVNKLTAWSYHTFPWELGAFFRYDQV